MNILIVTGGTSSERRISFMSARQVRLALKEKGYKVRLFDLKKGKDSLNQIARKFDAIFPVIHGEEGEAGRLHKFLKTIKKPIIGTDNHKGMSEAWYKISFKKYCDKTKIPSASWKEVKSKKDILKFGFPCILKSESGGSSREVERLFEESDFSKYSVKKLLKSTDKLFVEKFIKGVEVTVGILNGKALPIIEIVPPKNGWFDYKNKYWGKTQEIPFAPSVDKKLQEKIKKTSEKIHKDFNLGSFSRIDYMVDGENYYVLEVNTIPGLTASSLLPKAAKAQGHSFPDFIDVVVKSASK